VLLLSPLNANPFAWPLRRRARGRSFMDGVARPPDRVRGLVGRTWPVTSQPAPFYPDSASPERCSEADIRHVALSVPAGLSKGKHDPF
jgi:hypothetical protein